MLFSSELFTEMSSDKRGRPDSGTIDSRFLSGHPFATFFQTAENYVAASPENSMELQELLLYCWGLVHGISILIANQEKIPFPGDYLKTAEKIIRNEKFL